MNLPAHDTIKHLLVQVQTRPTHKTQAKRVHCPSARQIPKSLSYGYHLAVHTSHQAPLTSGTSMVLVLKWLKSQEGGVELAS